MAITYLYNCCNKVFFQFLFVDREIFKTRFYIFRDSWAVKVHELLPSVPCHYIVCMASNQDSFEDAKVLIVSYSLMERNCDKLLEKEFGFLILVKTINLVGSKKN